MRKRIVAALTILGLLSGLALIGCGNKSDNSKELTISIAASLEKPMNKIKELYEKDNKVKIDYNIASSGTLEKQIEEGAKVDVFFSANKKYINRLIDKDLIEKGKKYGIISNSLVLIENKKVDKKIKNLEQLIREDGKIAIGDPYVVPAGDYAKQTLQYLYLWDSLKPRIVYAKDVTAVKNYVEKGEVDFGFVYKTDAMNLKNSKIVYKVLSDYHEPIVYYAGIVDDSKNKILSRDFIKFLKSGACTDIFKDYGFKAR